MGTEISLDIGGLTISWSKNRRGIDHGFLFQPGDLQRCRSQQMDYDVVGVGDDPELAAYACCFNWDIWPFCRAARGLAPPVTNGKRPLDS